MHCLQAARRELHDFHEQGYNRINAGSPANSLPSPDTLGAAIHIPHPSPLKDPTGQEASGEPAAGGTIPAAGGLQPGIGNLIRALEAAPGCRLGLDMEDRLVSAECRLC